MQGRVGFLLSGPSSRILNPSQACLDQALFSLSRGHRLVVEPRGPPLGETLVSRWRRERGRTAYPWLARINPYKLTKKRGYQLARSRGEPTRGLPWFTMLKQKATHLAAHTSRHTHARDRRVPRNTRSFSWQNFRHTFLRKYTLHRE